MSAQVEVRTKKSTRWKKRVLRIVLGLLLFCLLAVGTVFILIFHGPLIELKELYVTTAMTTYTHQYLARWFVSEDEIQRIMEKHKVPEPQGNSDEKAVQVVQPFIKEKPPLEYIELSGKGFKGHLIKVGDPARVKLVATDQIGSTGLKVGEFVDKYHAVAGINAGGFSDPGGESRGGTPTGILITGGQIRYKDDLPGYSLIGLDKNNVLVLGRYTLKEIEELGIRDAVTFGPFLIVNGEPMIKVGDGGWGIAPRTAIAQTEDGTILMLVIDGRQIGSLGATLKDVQTILLEHGAYNAANLDGGSSSTLVFNGEIKNKPSSSFGPREVPSAFIVMSERNLRDEYRFWRVEQKLK